jgi:hypothetical protein
MARKSARVALALLCACAAEDQVPVDGPRFPTGLAVTPDGDHLVVISSDFDLAFDDGAVLVADLGRVRDGTDSGDPDKVVAGAYRSAALLPPFGDGPALSSDGSRLLVPTRGSNLVSSLDLSGRGALGCGSEEEPQRCGLAPRALQLPDNDPAQVIILDELIDEDDDLVRVDALVTLLSSPDVFFFSDDASRPKESRMQISATLHIGDGVSGVRSAVLRPEQSGSPRAVIAAIELDQAQGLLGALLAVFEPAGDAEVLVYDVTSETGAIALRDMVLVPGDDGANDALVLIGRAPDSLMRYELDDDGGSPRPRLAGAEAACRQPTSLALATLGTDEAPLYRVLLTCQEGDVVQMIDPLTLAVTGALRFDGRSPYDVVVSPNQPEAFVSFFLDNSVGVLGLENDDGAPSLSFRGRIGKALPKPEDGRQ